VTTAPPARTVLCTDTTVKMLPGQSNRLSWARSEKLNQFLNLSSFAEQMLVHEKRHRQNPQGTCRWKLAAPDRLRRHPPGMARW